MCHMNACLPSSVVDSEPALRTHGNLWKQRCVCYCTRRIQQRWVLYYKCSCGNRRIRFLKSVLTMSTNLKLSSPYSWPLWITSYMLRCLCCSFTCPNYFGWMQSSTDDRDGFVASVRNPRFPKVLWLPRSCCKSLRSSVFPAETDLFLISWLVTPWGRSFGAHGNEVLSSIEFSSFFSSATRRLPRCQVLFKVWIAWSPGGGLRENQFLQ